MKFGKLLTKTSDDMPEMHELFLRYKQLKKLLKAIPNNKEAGEQASAPAAAPANAAEAGGDVDSAAADDGASALASAPVAEVPASQPTNILSAAEQEFIKMLNEDLSRLNQFFIDKEEDAVIRLQLFADQLQSARAHEQMQLQQVKTTLVHFHGEMVLMLHWSLLNYAAVVKILKKHDKRTGLLLRAPYLSSVLQQPFYSTSIISRLVKRAEDLAQQSLILSPQNGGDGGMGSAPTTSSAEASTAAAPDEHALQLRHQAQLLKELQESANHIQEAATGNAAEDEMMAVAERLESQGAEVSMFRQTRLALETWAMLGRTASTPSTVLPTSAHHLAGQDAGPDGANASAAGDSAVQAGGTVSHVTGGIAQAGGTASHVTGGTAAAEEGRDSRGNSSDATAPAPTTHAGNGVKGPSSGASVALEEGQDGGRDAPKGRADGGTGAVGGKRRISSAVAALAGREEVEERDVGGTGIACKKPRPQGSS